jgi:uncharacterized membrane protein
MASTTHPRLAAAAFALAALIVAASAPAPAAAAPPAASFHGFLWHKGRFVTVDLPGATSTSLLEIDDRGRIVGGYQNAVAAPSPQATARPV